MIQSIQGVTVYKQNEESVMVLDVPQINWRQIYIRYGQIPGRIEYHQFTRRGQRFIICGGDKQG